MKKHGILIAAIGFICAIFIGCTTSVVSDEPINEVPESGTNVLNIHIEKNAFTRAEGDDDVISTLHIALYKSGATPQFVYILQAEKADNADNYTVTLPVTVSKPDFDMVIAYANLADADVKAIKTSHKSATTSTLQNNGKLLMSTAVTIVNEGESSAYKDYNDVSDTQEEMNVSITLDRVAAKVTVPSVESATLNTVSGKDLSGNNVSLSLTLTGWGIVNVDASSYLLRQLASKTTIADWMSGTNETLHWAESVKYGTLTTENTLDKVMVSELSNVFGVEKYVHESTRSEDELKKLDTKPSIVLVGQYKDKATNMGTFFRLRSTDGDIILSEDEYWESLAKEQTIIKKISGEAVTVDNLKGILELASYMDETTSYSHIVVPQLKDNATLTDYDITKVDDVNTALANTIQPMEIYEGGRCIFIVPIEHKKGDNDKVYSLVRNHKYTVKIKSISGLGHGVSGDNMVITEATTDAFAKTYKVNAQTITVNGWSENSQEVEIQK